MKMYKFHLIAVGLLLASSCLGNSNAERWNRMSEKERAEIRKRMASLSPEQLNQLRERKKQFERKPTDEKKRIRENQKRFHKMPKDRRLKMGRDFQQLKGLTESERQRLHEMSREERKKMFEARHKQFEHREKQRDGGKPQHPVNGRERPEQGSRKPSHERYGSPRSNR